ncbi:MAG: hypothetical protein D6681_16030 [Calditrichaeota bacterium]|nr:MAG: hypothetical protein D6681_16030 [Calditrichota bacterium]
MVRYFEFLFPKQIPLIGGIAFSLLVMLSACEEEVVVDNTGEVAFAAEFIRFPAQINLQGRFTYPVYVRVTHPRGSAGIDSVTVRFFVSGQQSPLLSLPLFDDGTHEDVIARDGVYSNTFSPVNPVVFPRGTILVRAVAVDVAGQIAETALLQVEALPNPPPVLLSVVAPDTLPSGTAPVEISVVVFDSLGVEDITAVEMRLTREGAILQTAALELRDRLAPDTARYGITVDSTLAVGHPTGDYALEFEATDEGQGSSGIVSRSLFMENLPPELFNPVLPDTVQRPASGVDTIEVHITVRDPQGLGDVSEVTFVVQRQGGPPTTIEMFDDGDFDAHRDLVAGDGIYSRGLTVSPTSTPGTFQFTFQALDLAGNVSPAVVDSLVILP